MELEERNPTVLIFSEEELSEKRNKFLNFIKDKCISSARNLFPDYIKDWKKMKYSGDKIVYAYKTAVIKIPCKYIKSPYKNRNPLYWSLIRDIELDRNRYSKEVTFYGLDEALRKKGMSYSDLDNLIYKNHGSSYKSYYGENVRCLFGGDMVDNIKDLINGNSANEMPLEYLIMCSKYLNMDLSDLVEFHYPERIIENEFEKSYDKEVIENSSEEGDFISFKNMNKMTKKHNLYKGYHVNDFYNVNRPEGDCYPLRIIREMCFYLSCTIDDLVSYSSLKP